MILNSFNESFFLLIQSFSTPALDYFFLLITTLGNPIFWCVISAILFWRGEEKKSFYLMNLIVVSAIAVGFLKSVFKIPRPSEIHQMTKGLLEHNFRLPADQFSFPSGHATMVSGAFVFFLNKIKKNWKIIFAIILVLVLISRVYLGKHFPIDVLAGLVLGLVIGATIIHLNNWLSNTEGKRELGIIVLFVLFLFVIFLFEEFAVTTLPLGYYVGLFLFKEFKWDSPKLFGSKFLKKTLTGLIGLGIIFLVLLLGQFSTAIQAVLFFFSGLWITLIFPFFFEIALKTRTTTKY